MSPPTEAQQWILSSHPKGLPTYGTSSSNFTLQTASLPDLQPGQILVETLYLSNDPAQRGWIASDIPEEKLYVPPVKLNTPMHARGLAKVLASKADGFSEGDTIQGNLGWTSHSVLDPKATQARVVQPLPGGLSVTQYLGALGSTGLTAHYGLMEIAGCKAGDRVVVSGAAGATGSMVVQLARIAGAKHIVGIAGSSEKCKWVESLGADACLNYKDADFEEKLKKATGEGCDVYFDNVGGKILDMMLGCMSRYGRIACCGAITGYNDEDAVAFKNYFYIISMRLQLKGFIVIDSLGKAPETIQKLVGYIKEGKLKIGDENETVVDTKFEEVPGTWLKLFEGGNQGKLVTKLV